MTESSRCWYCGTKLVDSSRLLTERRGSSVRVYVETGRLVCPHKCPSITDEEEVELSVESRDLLLAGHEAVRRGEVRPLRPEETES